MFSCHGAHPSDAPTGSDKRLLCRCSSRQHHNLLLLIGVEQPLCNHNNPACYLNLYFSHPCLLHGLCCLLVVYSYSPAFNVHSTCTSLCICNPSSSFHQRNDNHVTIPLIPLVSNKGSEKPNSGCVAAHCSTKPKGVQYTIGTKDAHTNKNSSAWCTHMHTLLTHIIHSTITGGRIGPPHHHTSAAYCW